MFTMYPTSYEVEENINELTIDDLTLCADEPDTEDYTTLKLNGAYQGSIFLTSFDHSNVPQDEVINTIRLRFRIGWSATVSRYSSIRFDLYKGDVLLKENVILPPFTANGSMDQNITVRKSLQYSDLADLKIRVVSNITSSGVLRSFKIFGIALDVGYEEYVLETNISKIGSDLVSKMYIGTIELISAYIGENKTYG